MMTPGGPGWNDPPSLSYETHTQTTSRRNLLTKRVGLPNLTVPNEPVVASPVNKDALPPSCKKDLPPPPKLKPESTIQNESTSPSADQSKATENTVKFLNPATDNTNEKSLASSSGEDQAVSQMPTVEGVTIFDPSGRMDKDDEAEQVKKAEDDAKQCDIESVNVDIVVELKKLAECCHDNEIITAQVKNAIIKKVAILEKQINESKLSDPVLKKVEAMTKFLVLKKYDSAWDTHLALVCDHSSSVMQWMAGVRKLISEAKNLK